MEIRAKYIHGSQNSLDVDTMYVVDELPSLQECKVFCSSKEDNRNLIVIKDGIVVDCYKGTPDECNNSLFRTYNLHEQEYPLLVEREVERDVPLKAIRAVRGILSHLSRTSYRPIIKKALKSDDWAERLNALKQIDLKSIDFDTIQNNMSGADIKKLIAFQIAQTSALKLLNKELYTKNEVSEFYPSLKPYMERSDIGVLILEIYLKGFAYICENIDVSQYDLLTEKKK